VKRFLGAAAMGLWCAAAGCQAVWGIGETEETTSGAAGQGGHADASPDARADADADASGKDVAHEPEADTSVDAHDAAVEKDVAKPDVVDAQDEPDLADGADVEDVEAEALVCPPGWADCTSAPGCETNTNDEFKNCGACGYECSGTHGQPVCVSGKCNILCTPPFVNCNADPADGCEAETTSDTEHCGSCNIKCAVAHGQPACVSGVCGVGTCESGWADCDGALGNGCEIDLNTSATHCGGCSNACATNHAVPSCVAGICTLSCSLGWGDCDMDPSNGCEGDLLNDSLHCGTCSMACDPNGGTPSCNNGKCGIACDPGLGDCTSDAGCETDITTSVSHCGGCGHACSTTHGTPSCASGSCQVACESGFADCDASVGNGCETDLSTDALHCGDCAMPCSTTNGTASCAGSTCSIACNPGFGDCDSDPGNGCETPLNSDPLHCAQCGNACSNNHGTPACVAGACGIMCAPGFFDCDGNVGNGCEIDTTSDVANCGTCGHACSSIGGIPSCVLGVCTIACSTGFGDCDGSAENGCEVNLGTDAQHCSDCATSCDGPHGTGSCSGAVCSISCAVNWGDCNGSLSDGCEVDLLNDKLHCSACTTVCTPQGGSPSCNNGVCGIACDPGLGDCIAGGGCETDLGKDVLNCGGCGHVCSSAHGTPSCTAGSCGIDCSPGWADCNANESDGCEVNVSTDTAHCGTCATVCSTVHGVPTCSGGNCSITCSAGFGDCDGTAANGCEINLNTDPLHCGGCPKACIKTNGTASCTAGTCGITCSPGFANCDNDASNGCEINLNTEPTHCGSCSTACSTAGGTAGCTVDGCTISCSPGFGNCDGNVSNGCETDIKTSATNCGGCGVACNSTHGTPACAAGVCSITCASGWDNCDAKVSTGCEADLKNDENHCGSCTKVCSPTGGTPSCNNGACGISCSAGFGDCDGNVGNGCETNINTSATNCGGCGLACSTNHATATCNTGSCVLTCLAGWGNCDGNLLNGCETNLNADSGHCGTCTTACGTFNGTASCSVGKCVIACNNGFGDCDSNTVNGCEVNLNTDAAHCNSCSTACSTYQGYPTCAGGVCSISCSTGYANCDGNVTNGCEIDLKTDKSHCGSCTKVCSSNHGAASCTNGACGITCGTGWANCDSDITNGCETDTTVSFSHCGSCGHPCVNTTHAATATCVSSACAIQSCDNGYFNQNASYADGCECAGDLVPDTCTTLASTAVPIQATTQLTGSILGATDVDYWLLTFAGASCTAGPKIVLNSNANPIFMKVYTSCVGGSGSGGITCTDATDTQSANFTTWELKLKTCGNGLGVDPTPDLGTFWNSPMPPTGQVYVKVYGTGSNTSCMAYSLTVTNAGP
jgi:hypothetical protein